MSDRDRDLPVIVAAEAAEALLASADRSGVRTIWFTSGSELAPLQEAAAKAAALRRPAPRIVTVPHEHVGLCLAMGETLVTGGPSCAAAHADLGLLNFGGAIHNAALGGYPVLMISGYPPTTPAERTAPVFWKQQRRDPAGIVRQYVKWDFRPAVYDDLSVVTARAVQVALSPPRGPVYLALPAEVVGHPVGGEVTVLGAGDLGVPVLGAGPPDAVTDIARRLLAAEAPLVLTDRVGRDPRAVALLAELAERFALAVRATRHRMNLPDGHPASAGATPAGTALTGADAVLVLEHPVPWIPAAERPDPAAFVAVVGEDPAATGIPLYEFAADLRVTADAAAFLAALGERMDALRTDAQRHRHADRWASMLTRRSELDAARAGLLRRDRAAGIPTPAAVAAAVGEVVEPEDVFTWELADTDGVTRTRAGTLFDKGGSSLGWAVAAATGARYSDRARPAVCLTGDGSYMFGVSPVLLWMQQHLDAPVLTVICNNRGYRTGTQTVAERYPDGYAVASGDFSGGFFDPPPDFAAEARAAGGFGARVHDLGELAGTLAGARRAVEVDRRPAVVDVWLPAHVTGAHPLAGRS
ncbi:MAG TPA: thiamine pyrophosphate-dependent enzyme [Mycobacteriales bacterium]|nr:thiamine pyrophosphate-dependent enzyme [Mycobacteriales bacterium]